MRRKDNVGEDRSACMKVTGYSLSVSTNEGLNLSSSTLVYHWHPGPPDPGNLDYEMTRGFLIVGKHQT
jgi:hypothetical protein